MTETQVVPPASDDAMRGRTLLTLADQALYSASNFALAIVVAHYATRREYGVFAVVLAAFLIGSGLNRGMTGGMLGLKRGTVAPRWWRRLVLMFTGRALVVGLLSGAALAAIMIGALPGYFLGTTLALAVAAPLAFAQDTVRYAAFACRQPRAALVSDSVFGLTQVVVTTVLVLSGTTTVYALILAWALGAVTGSAAGLLALRLTDRSDGGTRPTFAWHDGLSIRLGLDNVLGQLTQQGTTFLIAGLGAVSGAASLRVVQTLFGPAIVLVLGFQAAYTRELVRRRQVSFVMLRTAVRRAGVFLGSFIAVTMLLALAIPGSVGSAVFGPSWGGTRVLVLIFGVGAIGGGVTSAAVSGLRALEDAQRTLRVRVSALVLTLGLVAAGGALDSVRGAAAGLSLASSGVAVYWWLQFERSWRASRRPLPGRGEPTDELQSLPDLGGPVSAAAMPVTSGLTP